MKKSSSSEVSFDLDAALVAAPEATTVPFAKKGTALTGASGLADEVLRLRLDRPLKKFVTLPLAFAQDDGIFEREPFAGSQLVPATPKGKLNRKFS
jgi:hypothetical protein